MNFTTWRNIFYSRGRGAIFVAHAAGALSEAKEIAVNIPSKDLKKREGDSLVMADKGLIHVCAGGMV